MKNLILFLSIIFLSCGVTEVESDPCVEETLSGKLTTQNGNIYIGEELVSFDGKIKAYPFERDYKVLNCSGEYILDL